MVGTERAVEGVKWVPIADQIVLELCIYEGI